MAQLCVRCGAVAEDEAKFCGQCAGPVGAASALPPVPMPVAVVVPPEVERRTRRIAKLIVAGVVLLVVVAVGGFVLVDAKPNTHTVTGTFVLSGTTSTLSPTIFANGGICWGKGGYSDIAAGTPVTLKDEAATILATAALGLGTGTDTECTFTFTLTGVSDSAKFYSVEVGRRGAISKSHDELEADGWVFGLTLGN
jgi:hypothetical protein